MLAVDQKLSSPFMVRLPEETLRRLGKMEASCGVNRTTILRSCVEAALAHFESKGKISFPVRISDEPEKPDAFSRKK